jgi:predicted CXXCH cytochrome family protein
MFAQRGSFFLTVTLIMVAFSPCFAEKGDEEKGCLDCHPEFYKERLGTFNHPPFQEKKCEICHVFHEFTQEMVLAGPVLDLCIQCHESKFMLPEEDFHYPAVEEDACMSCHNPHSSDRKGLLKGSSPGICLE